MSDATSTISLRVRLSVAALALSGLTACTTAAPEVTNGDPVLREGRDIYTGQCARCHGLDGGGGRGKPLNGGRLLEDVPTLEAQMAIVSDGQDDMPAFGGRLTAEQIEAVSRYTREIIAEVE